MRTLRWRVSKLIHSVLIAVISSIHNATVYMCTHTHINTYKIDFLSTHLACENVVVTVTRWGCNHGDYKLVILWSPDWWTFGGCVPSCRKSPDTQTAGINDNTL